MSSHDQNANADVSANFLRFHMTCVALEPGKSLQNTKPWQPYISNNVSIFFRISHIFFCFYCIPTQRYHITRRDVNMEINYVTWRHTRIKILKKQPSSRFPCNVTDKSDFCSSLKCNVCNVKLWRNLTHWLPDNTFVNPHSLSCHATQFYFQSY